MEPIRTAYRGAVLGLFFILILHACVDNRRSAPTSPSSIESTHSLNWDCVRVNAQRSVVSGGGWSFTPAAASCPSVRALAPTGGLPITGAPQNLRATVVGFNVALNWDFPPGEIVSGFQLEGGSGPGLADLAVVTLPSSQNFLSVVNVPPGVYYVRVRGMGGVPPIGPPSNEAVVRVGIDCGGPPAAPTALTGQVAGNNVTLLWNAPLGESLNAYIIEVGSALGLSNLLVFDTGSISPSISGSAGNGTYYVRVRARNQCGVGPPSNEAVIVIGSTTTVSTTTVPTSTTTTPTTTTTGSTTASSTSTSTTSTTSTSTTSTTTTTIAYTAKAAVTGRCMVYGSCTDSCTLTASSDVPSATYVWDLGKGVKVTGATLNNPDMKHWCGTFGGSSTISVPVTVTASGMGGATATSPSTNVTVVQQT